MMAASITAVLTLSCLLTRAIGKEMLRQEEEHQYRKLTNWRLG